MADANMTDFETPVAVDQTAKRKRLFGILGIALLVIGIAVAIWWFLTQQGRVETDNAYVGADSAQVTALVPGPVAQEIGRTRLNSSHVD